MSMRLSENSVLSLRPRGFSSLNFRFFSSIESQASGSGVAELSFGQAGRWAHKQAGEQRWVFVLARLPSREVVFGRVRFRADHFIRKWNERQPEALSRHSGRALQRVRSY
jgi:hypothetical protein